MKMQSVGYHALQVYKYTIYQGRGMRIRKISKEIEVASENNKTENVG